MSKINFDDKLYNILNGNEKLLQFFINNGFAERMLDGDRPGGRRCALAALRRRTAARLRLVGRLRTTSEHQAHSRNNGGNP